MRMRMRMRMRIKVMMNNTYKIKIINDVFKKIDETKSFKDQIDVLKEIPDLNDYWYMKYYHDNKERNLRIFKVKITNILNDVDDILFT